MSESQAVQSFTAPLSELYECRERQYRVGEFIVDPVEKTLVCQGQELTIEPKVFDVLLYFCENPDRYIQTQELHDQVWQGTLVSDAAVRRAVSKLRTILGDDSKCPTFIKSGSKRGYKFIGQLSHEVEELAANPTDIIAPSIIATNTVRQHTTSAKVAPWLVTAALGLLFIVSGAIGAYLFLSTRVQNQQLTLDRTPLFDYLGEKKYLAVAYNNEAIGFTSKLPGLSGFQVFLHNEDGSNRQLTTSANNVIKFDFNADGSTLYYIDIQPGSATLSSLDIVKPKQQPVTLVDGFYYISDLALLMDGSGLYFNGLKSLSESSRLYYLDLSTGSFTTVTNKLSADFHENKLALSKENKYLAHNTVMGKLGEQQITIRDLKSKKVVTRIYHDSAIYQLCWLNERQLLIVDEKGIHSADIETQAKNILFENHDEKIQSVATTKQQNIIVINAPAAANFFTQISLDDFNFDNQQVISADPNIRQMLFTGVEHKKLIYRKQGNISVVSTIEGNKETIHLKTSSTLEIYQAAKKGRLILSKIDNALALIDTQSSEITYITQGTSFDGQDATFSKNFDQVLFSMKNNGELTLYSYNIAEKSLRPLFEGFRAARETANGYILADGADRVHYYRNENKSLSKLNVELAIDNNTRWFVRNNLMYWSKFDGKNTFLNTFDLVEQRLTKQKLESIQLDPRFDVDAAGHWILLKNSQPASSEILAIH